MLCPLKSFHTYIFKIDVFMYSELEKICSTASFSILKLTLRKFLNACHWWCVCVLQKIKILLMIYSLCSFREQFTVTQRFFPLSGFLPSSDYKFSQWRTQPLTPVSISIDELSKKARRLARRVCVYIAKY